MRRFATSGLLVAGLTLIMPVTRGTAEEMEVKLTPGEGVTTVETNCGGCHSLDYIVMNSPFLKQENWKAEVGKMRKAFGAPINDVDADTIIRYLADNYGAPSKP